MSGAHPDHGKRCDRGAEQLQRLQVLHGQIVVWGAQATGLRADEFFCRRLPGHREGHATAQFLPEQFPVGVGEQAVRRSRQGSGIPALTAEGQHVHHAGRSQQRHRSLGKGLRRRGRPHGGQLQHQVGTATESAFRTPPFVHDSGLAPLDKVPAHHADDTGVTTQKPSGFGNMPAMPQVKRVIFRHNTGNLHEFPSAIKNSSI